MLVSEVVSFTGAQLWHGRSALARGVVECFGDDALVEEPIECFAQLLTRVRSGYRTVFLVREADNGVSARRSHAFSPNSKPLAGLLFPSTCPASNVAAPCSKAQSATAASLACVSPVMRCTCSTVKLHRLWRGEPA